MGTASGPIGDIFLLPPQERCAKPAWITHVRGGPLSAAELEQARRHEGTEGEERGGEKGVRRAAPRGLKPAALRVEDVGVFDQDPAEVLAIDEALKKLEQADPRMAEVVMLRFFAGLTGDETAAALELSPRTVDSDWHFARIWLDRELS